MKIQMRNMEWWQACWELVIFWVHMSLLWIPKGELIDDLRWLSSYIYISNLEMYHRTFDFVEGKKTYLEIDVTHAKYFKASFFPLQMKWHVHYFLLLVS